MFTTTPVEEVHLGSAPLAKVLMQVQFSRTPALITESADDAMADALGRYPVRRRTVVSPPVLLINGQPMPFQVPQASLPEVLTFSQPNGTWTVTLTDTAVALETSAYTTRADFCDRVLELLRAVASVALPPVVDRVGVRYIDRLSGEALARVGDYVIPELSVLHGRIDSGLTLERSVSESLIHISPLDRLLVRSGFLPAGSGFDPALPQIQEPSWVLDMDVFTLEKGLPFDPDILLGRVRSYAETAYAFFRFATTDAFQADHLREEQTPTVRDAQ